MASQSPASLAIAADGPVVRIVGEGLSPLAVEEKMVERHFREQGALLLRGFEFDFETFHRFCERLCSTAVFNESRKRAVIDSSLNLQSVDLGTDPFPLHPELSREPWKPDACLFACFNAPSREGETTFCDGMEIVRRLPPRLVEEMLRHQLLYSQPAAPEVLQYWLGTATPTDAQLAAPPPPCPYRFGRVDGRIHRSFLRPVLHKPMFQDELAFGNFLIFARDALRMRHFPRLENGQFVPDSWLDAVRVAAEPITYALKWQRGEILILDNSRFMHGRRRIVDPAERLIASYFGYVRFAEPSEYEPSDPPWRKETFRPPVPARRHAAPSPTITALPR